MSSRSCGQWSDAIVDRLAEELPEADAILLEQHLSECPDCAGRERILRTLFDSMKTAERFVVDPALEEILIRRIHTRDDHEASRLGAPAESRVGPAWKGALHFLWRPIPLYAALVLLVAACISGVWVGHRGDGGRIAESRWSVVQPGAPQDSPAPARVGRRSRGFVATPSDAVCLLGTLGHDTL